VTSHTAEDRAFLEQALSFNVVHNCINKHTHTVWPQNYSSQAEHIAALTYLNYAIQSAPTLPSTYLLILSLECIHILPVVLYWCETWSLTLREERRLRVFERIFGSMRDGVTGVWR
jgi:hypothetical protein